MHFPHLNKRNIFIIPAGDFFNKEKESCYLIFSPLANCFLLALPNEVLALEKMVSEQKSNDLLNKLEKHIPLEGRNLYYDGYDSTATLYILLNEKCNFHCKYCYSAEGRSKAELTLDEIKTSLDFFLSKDRKSPVCRKIMFIGGGEPTLSWTLVDQATEYAEETAIKNGIELKKELTTNGSILTHEMLDFYKKHNFELQISFEVIPDIQDDQRGQFNKVSENLKLLGENNIKCRIRSTITELNVKRLEEMIELCYRACKFNCVS